MSHNLTEMLPKLLSIDHKCRESECKAMSVELENMKKYILFCNQLNDYYLNKIKTFNVNTNKDLFEQQKQSFIDSIEAEVQAINDNVDQLFADQDMDADRRRLVFDTAIDSKTSIKSTKLRCDLCHKWFLPQILINHLNQHLNNNLDQKSVSSNKLVKNDNKANSGLNTAVQSADTISASDELFVNSVVKQEPSDESNDGSDWAEDNHMVSNDNSSEEEFGENVWTKSTGKPTHRSKATKSLSSLSADVKCEESNGTNGDINENSDLCEEHRCDDCVRVFASKKSLAIHLSRKHSIRSVGKRKASYHRKKVLHKCDLCEFTVMSTSKRELRQHALSEHNIEYERLTCSWPECNKVFRKESALDSHIRQHKGDLKYKCDYPGCDRQYNEKTRIEIHMRVHTGEKPYECHWPGCGLQFRHHGTLKSHMYTHDKNKQRNHLCYFPGCDKSYDTNSKLMEHIYSVHRKEDKPYKCQVEGCKSSCVSAKNLRLHMRTQHSEHRPKFQCTAFGERCQRTFFSKEALDNHMKKPHANLFKRKRHQRYPSKRVQCDWPGCDFMTDYPHKIKIHKMRAHTGEKPIQCSWSGCQFSCVRKYELDCHMMKHTGETPFPCEHPQCGRRFKSQRALDTHWDKNHTYSEFVRTK